MYGVKYNSYLKEINQALVKAEKERRGKAAKFVANQLKDVTTSKFGSDSGLTKGVKYVNDIEDSKVGIGAPGFHAHLIEFGTDDRFTKSGKGTGHVTADPFIFKTFDENAEAVKEILSEPWIK